MARNGTPRPGVISSRDCQAAALVAAGHTYAEVGAQLKLSERTVKRTLMRPEVRAEVDAIRERAVEAGLGLLCLGLARALKELERLVQHGTPQDSVKLGAVKLTIESVVRVRENVLLAKKMELLQEQIAELIAQQKALEDV